MGAQPKITPPGPIVETSGGCLARIRAWLRDGSASTRRIGAFVLNEPARTVGMSVTELAAACRVSQSSVSRFCSALGFSGFKAFQLDLAAAVAQSGRVRLDEFVAGESAAATVKRIFEGNRQTLAETERMLDGETMEHVVDCLQGAGRICILGLGASGLIARYAAQRFLGLGCHVTALDDPYDQLFATAAAGRGDAVIGISHSGRTRGVVEALRAARRHRARTIALTNYSRSPLAETCEFKLITAFHESRLSAAFSSSQVAQMSVIDSLFFILAGRDLKRATRRAREAEERTERLLQ
jgi:DNA-binding MurR/RpiR family transcriptional regulator